MGKKDREHEEEKNESDMPYFLFLLLLIKDRNPQMQSSQEDVNRILNHFNLQNTKTMNKVDEWETTKHLQKKDNWTNSSEYWKKIAGNLEFILS